jgi:hypothetical protein
MRSRVSAVAIAGLMSLGGMSCARTYDVHTMAAPKATLTEFHTFHVLPTPRRRDGQRPSGAYDPMVSNSITNRALRASVADAFEKRGYVDVEWMPDFVVAVYASAHEKLDLSQWQFGYYGRPHWWDAMPPHAIAQYTEGTVVVDVIDPETLDLLWRGSATAALGDDPEQNTKELQKAAVAIIEKFPRVRSGPVVATR